MPISTITSKGQVTIPKSIREQFNFQPGDRLEFIVEDGERMVVQPVTRDISELKGVLSYLNKPMVTDAQIDDAIGKQISEDNL
ncbi:MAG: AbrB/MazE/SpoVT family DNA-binding domain-containing protein [Magnetococcales bacterium]|nr:AbrB/MazE/SpoVT family DNA-binding domain-containing protein [Magnetococcales bacterium]